MTVRTWSGSSIELCRSNAFPWALGWIRYSRSKGHGCLVLGLVASLSPPLGWPRDVPLACFLLIFLELVYQRMLDRVHELSRTIDRYVAMTRKLEEHPEGFNEWCECATCVSYADLDDGEGGRLT